MLEENVWPPVVDIKLMQQDKDPGKGNQTPVLNNQNPGTFKYVCASTRCSQIIWSLTGLCEIRLYTEKVIEPFASGLLDQRRIWITQDWGLIFRSKTDEPVQLWMARRQNEGLWVSWSNSGWYDLKQAFHSVKSSGVAELKQENQSWSVVNKLIDIYCKHLMPVASAIKV